MILVSEVYDTLIDQIRADKRGLSLSPEEFNRFARLVNERVYSKFYKEFETTSENSETLGGFKEFNETIALTGGIGSLPDDFKELIGMPRVLVGSTYRGVDLVSTYELAKREMDYLTQPSTTYPVCQLGGLDANDNLQIRIYPITIATVYVDYLRTAAVPFLDYYVNDTTLVYTFMDADATVSVPLGSTARNGTAGLANVDSATVNFEWDDGEFPLILSLFAQMVGLALPSEELIQVGNNEEMKNQ
jgi:hypothetical protein